MNYAVVDTGSNTIRMSVYSYENGTLSELYTEAIFANLAGHIVENALTDEGISVCADAIRHHRKKAAEFDAQFCVFATAAIRNAENCAQIVEKIHHLTGEKLEIISGKDEGELSFLGAFEDFGTESGVMVDVGGGSSEVVVFEKGKPLFVQSIPIGSLKAYKNFVKGELPTKAEADSIKEEIKKYLDENSSLQNIFRENLCIVGGGVRAAHKLCRATLGKDKLDFEAINAMLDTFLEDRNSLALFEKIVPKRKYTICPGLAIYSAIGTYFGAENVRISDKGIKEGYVKKYLIH